MIEISAKAADDLVAASEALVENIVVWLQKSHEETIADLANVGMDGIPAKNGHLLSDEEVMVQFSGAFTAALDGTQYRERLSPNDVYREFKRLFSERLIYGGVAVSRRAVLKYFRESINICAGRTGQARRYIACNICHFDTPITIDLGVVRFIPAEMALKILDDSMATVPDQLADMQKEHRWAGPPQRRIDALRGHYQAFDWAAEVSISGFDTKRGLEHAYRLAQGGLDFLHLLIGAPYSDRMRLDWKLLDADRPASFAILADGTPATTVNYRSTSRHLDDGWWDSVKENAGKDGVELFRLVIERANDPDHIHVLARRYMDALTWYGDAVREKVSVSRLLKFVMAVELLIGTSEKVDISRKLSRRGASLLFMRNYGDLHELYRKLLTIYDARSAVVHGSISPRDGADSGILVAAEDISRSLLIEALSVFGRKAFNEGAVSQRRVRKFFDSIEEGAVAAYGKGFPEIGDDP
jgi:hypothetical protein